MDLSTRYLDLTLSSPLMPGASPLAADMNTVRRLEDAGAAAIVVHSLFEEQIVQDRLSVLQATEDPAESFAEAISFFPKSDGYRLGPEAYLEHVRRIKAAVDVPVIASLNGLTPAGWTDYARLIEQAGADALELNVYFVAADPTVSSAAIEDRVVDVARRVKSAVEIPVAVKLSPFFSALHHLVRRLRSEAIDGLVLFNRFYQPDIDIEALETTPTLELSTPAELRLRLRWLAILSAEADRTALAVSGGIHDVGGVLKAVMAGADAVQVVSALLRHGPQRLAQLRADLVAWLEEHEYESLAQARGSMNLARCPDPVAFERANYLAALTGWNAANRPLDVL